MCESVPFAEWTGELLYYARLSRTDGAEAKASLNRALKYDAIDPKPSDLAMSRLKLGWLVVSGEIPNELGDSWFSPK